MGVRLKEIIGFKNRSSEGERKDVDEALDEWINRIKAEKLERAKWLELEEWLKKKELSIAEMEKKLEELKGLGGVSVLRGVAPKLSKEELEIVKLLLDMNDEDRVKALQILMLLKGGVANALPLLLASGGSSNPSSIKELAETINTIVSTARSLMPNQSGGSGGGVKDTIIQTLLTKVIDLAEKRASEARNDNNPLNEVAAKLLSYAVEQLTAPRGSEIDYMADRLSKLKEIATILSPPAQGGSSLDVYKIWLEMKKLDQEYEKWKTELAMKQQSEERRLKLLNQILNTVDISGAVRSFLGNMAASSRGASNLPTVVCDPSQGGCGAPIPVPPGVNEVVCARCGKRWSIRAKGEASKEAGEAS